MNLENILSTYYKTDEKIILGCSAGPDSMFLLYKILQTSYKQNLVVCYFNHKTRPETEEEEQFLEELCKKENIGFETASCDFEKIQKLYPSRSFEELAREKRYQFFDAIMHIHGTNKVILGHHLDDKIETFVFNMLRGSKLSGLINMKEFHGGILRPLLNTSKHEILNYLQKNNLKYKVDQTNFENNYTRNKVRNLVIPELEKIHPQSKKNIANLMHYFENVQEFIDEEVEKFLSPLVPLTEGERGKSEADLLRPPSPPKEREFKGEVKERKFPLLDTQEKKGWFSLSDFLKKEVIRYMFYISNNQSTIGLSESNIAEIIRFIAGKNNKTIKEIRNLKMKKDGNFIYW